MEYLTPIVLPLLLGAAWGGWRLQRSLAERYRSRDTVEAVRLVLSMLVTFVALVLGLLTSSAKGHYDQIRTNLQTYSIDLISLDQRLREYGPDAVAIRSTLRAYTAAGLADTWPSEPQPAGAYPRGLKPVEPGSLESENLGEMLLQVDRMIAQLAPADPVQRQLAQVLSSRMQQLLQDRWILVGSGMPTISWPLIATMVFWLMLVFAIFGISSPYNDVVAAVIAMAAVSVFMALWLILDYDAPLSGLIQIPSGPMRDALLHMDVH